MKEYRRKYKFLTSSIGIPHACLIQYENLHIPIAISSGIFEGVIFPLTEVFMYKSS